MIAPLILLSYVIWRMTVGDMDFWESFVLGAAFGSSAYMAWKYYFDR